MTEISIHVFSPPWFEEEVADVYHPEFSPGPPQERTPVCRGVGGGMWYIPEGSLDRSLCTTPSAGPGVRPGCGGGSPGRSERVYCSACAECLSASEGWVLLVHR